MNAKNLLVSSFRSVSKYYCVFLTIIALANFSTGQTIAGTLTVSSTTTTTSGTCSLRTTTDTWTFTDTLNVAHGFPKTTNTHLLLGCSSSCNPGGTKSGCTTGCGCPPTGSTSQSEWSSDGRYFLQATGSSGSVTAEAGYVDPKFLLLGVTYAPPGPSATAGASPSSPGPGRWSSPRGARSSGWRWRTSRCPPR